ncbi:MAG: flagellar basal-body rod protein FlgF [Bradyrhizobiaceae bacterium]|nr:flagellar basal-body rod protein FlgF [Hyphomicrobiales bacterium]MBV9426473.1 flagellar basal-body rod protein FlgF [Bradyrhizobiaceae bacterium]
MENALLVGLSRQMALQREMEVVANNIANIDTNGFKADFSLFEEYLMPGARDGNFRVADSPVSFVRDRGTLIDLNQGPFQHTGNPLDVAINGDGFLVINTPQGERYTRNGALAINPQGELVTSEGYQVLGDGGPIAFQNQDTGVTINPEGTVSVKDPSNSSVAIIRGQLRVASFAQPARLQKEGGSTFSAPADMPATPSTKSNVVQGALEKSNVRPIIEMSRMIEISRSYAAIANLLQSEGDLHKTSLQQLSDVPTS